MAYSYARNGQDYYRVQGHDLQQIQTAEWLNAKPRMAIFVLDDCDRAAALAGPGAGIGRRQAWKRRRVEVRQPSSFPRLGHGGDGGGGVVRMSSSSPAEVIEVKDDDSDHEENTCEIIPATAVVGDTPAAPAAAAGHRAAGNNGGGGCNNDCDAPVVIPATAVPAARGRSAESNRDLSLAWAAGGEACGEGRRRRARRSPSKLLGAHSGAVGSSADKALRVSFGSDNNNDDLYKDDDDDDAGTRWSAAAAREQGISAADMAVSKSFRLATDVEADARPAFYAATAESLCGSSGPDASRCSSSSPPAWTPCTTRGARGVGSDGGIGNARGGAAGRLPSEPGHEDLTTRDDGQETDEGDDDVQVVANGQAGPGSDAGGGTGGAASPSTPYVEGSGRAAREERDGNGEGNRDGPNCAPSTKGNVFAAIADDASLNVALGLSLTYRSGEGRPLELSASTGAETADDGGARPVGAERAGAAAVRSSDTSFRQSPTRATPQRRLADQQQQLEREVHDVDDDVSADSPPLSDNTAMKMKHPSGVSMPFIGPARPPPPPRLDTETVAETSPRLRWLSPSARPTPRPLTQNSEKRKRERGTGGVGGVGGGRTSEPAQRKIAWGRTSPLLALAPDPGGGEADEDEEWTPSGRGDKSSSDFGGGGAATSSSIKTRSSGVGGGGGGGGEGGGGAKAMEDLTGAEHGSSREEEEEREAVINRGRAWASRLKDGSEARGDEATLTTIRGINLRQDHFDRIVDSDGWLTSQIIDIRVKQLQEKYPQHLYFDSSFFGFLCPTNDKGGAFVVDYARVRGWTKSSRLPPGKSSLFEMQKLFIPINQGNVHWVLIVVDFGFPQDGGVEDVGGKGGRGGGRKTVSFFDSFGRDGTSYVEAVQEYLVHELSSRDETRQGLFFTEPRPPDNAPRQHNRSDCGVLMLHVMEEMSTNQGETLSRLTQEQIMSLRLELVAKIIE